MRADLRVYGTVTAASQPLATSPAFSIQRHPYTSAAAPGSAHARAGPPSRCAHAASAVLRGRRGATLCVMHIPRGICRTVVLELRAHHTQGTLRENYGVIQYD